MSEETPDPRRRTMDFQPGLFYELTIGPYPDEDPTPMVFTVEYIGIAEYDDGPRHVFPDAGV
jgi:hypothetical protein